MNESLVIVVWRLLVFRLRELSNIEKQENQRLQKQLDGQKLEMTGLTKDREKLQKDVGQLEVEIIELKEMVRCRRSFVRFHQGRRLTVSSLSTCLQPPPALRPRHGPVRNSPLTLRLVLYIYRA